MFSRVFGLLEPEAFSRALLGWMQHEIVRNILRRNGDYLIQVKTNQGALYDDLKLYFDQMKKEGFESVPHGKASTPEASHDRVETRTAWSVWQIEWLKQRHDWAGLNSIVCVEAERENNGQTSTEQRYSISSLDGRDAEQLLNASRGHWGFENRLHWSLDMTFKEDHSRVRKDHGPANLAALRRVVLELLKQETTARTSLKSKRRRCAMAHEYLQTVLSLP